VVFYLLDAWFLLLWWNILGKVGFILLSFEIGKKFMHIVSVSSCFMVSYCLIFYYKVIHPPLRYILILNKHILAKVSRRSKRAYTLQDLPC
jgi:hypothetical protein